MPTIEVPLQSWKEISNLRKSKKFAKLASEAATLARQEKFIRARRQELSLELYDILNESLDSEVKSIEYEGVRLTKIDGGETSRFNKKKLMTIPIPCANPKCKAVNHVTSDVIDECTDRGTRRPSVSVTPIDDGEDGEE